MAEKMIITNAGLQEMEDELHHLKVVTRKEIAQKIKEAREQGDLSENAEYDAAMDEQRDIEARIKELEKMLKNVEVVDESEIDLDTVNIGCVVRVKDLEFKEEIEYRLVGSKESDIMKNKISNESPIGKALIGSKVGQTVTVEAPDGEFKYKVLDIQRAKK